LGKRGFFIGGILDHVISPGTPAASSEYGNWNRQEMDHQIEGGQNPTGKNSAQKPP
jgi:hypothetical protein